MSKEARFDDLINAIQEAFIKVNHMSEIQHIESLSQYFEEDGTAKTLKMNCPYFDEAGTLAYREMKVPLISITPVSSLKLQEIELDFKVQLYGKVSLESKNDPSVSRLANPLDTIDNSDASKEKDTVLGYIPQGGLIKNKDNYANVHLKFTSEDPPEGLMRIKDQFTKVTI